MPEPLTNEQGDTSPVVPDAPMLRHQLVPLTRANLYTYRGGLQSNPPMKYVDAEAARQMVSAIDALRARLAEFDAAVEQASALIGSEYRNAGVIVAALDWQKQRIAELERERENWQTTAEEGSWPYEWEVATRLKEQRDALRSEVERLRAALYDVLEMCLDPNDANESFEQVGRLYERATGHLRPGKDDPFRDSSSDENRKRFHEWHDAEWGKRYAAARKLAPYPEAPDAES